MSTALLIREAAADSQSANFSWVKFVTRTITSTALAGMQGVISIPIYHSNSNATARPLLEATERVELLETARGLPVMIRADSFSASGQIYMTYKQSYVECQMQAAVGISPIAGASTYLSATYTKELYYQIFGSYTYSTGLVNLKPNGWFSCGSAYQNSIEPTLYIICNGLGTESGSYQGTPSTNISVTATVAYLNGEPDID